MRDKSIFVAVILAICVCSNNCKATILGDIQFVRSGGSNIVISAIEYRWDVGNWSVDKHEISWGVVTPEDVGSTITLSSATASEFNYYTSLLTSGQDDYFTISIHYPEHTSYKTSSAPESEWLSKFIDNTGPDFCGYEVTEIALTINSLTLDSPGSNPNGDDVWTDYTFDATFTISGELVPEPTTLLLLGLGAVILRRKR